MTNPTSGLFAQASTSHSRSKPRTHHKPHKQLCRAISLHSGLCTTSRLATSHGLVAHKHPHKPKQNQENSQENHSAQANTGRMAHKPAQATAISRTRPMAHKARLRRTRTLFQYNTIYIYIYTYMGNQYFDLNGF